jgi:tetratricopeptide (TPR) repeat protein
MSRGWLAANAATSAEARRLADEALACDEDEAWAHLAVGICLARYGDFEGALSAFREALARNPSFATARGWIGAVSSIAGNLEEGRIQLIDALRLSPNDPALPMLYSSLAACCILGANYHEAAEWASKAVHLHANYPPALRNLTTAYAAIGDMDRARDALERLRAADPALTIATYKQSHPMFGRLGEIHAHWLRVAGLPEV